VFGDGALDALGLAAESGTARQFGGGVVLVDPRLSELGARALVPREGARTALAAAGLQEADFSEWDRLRLECGVPDGSRDLVIDKTILLEAGFDELNGIDWQKGCYVGQELTARTRYRGLIKRRLLPVHIDGSAPPPGAPITAQGRDAGEMRSSRDGTGLALLRLECLDAPLAAGEAKLAPFRPDWLRLPAAAQ
jgi:folate-binding protein YgfZ